jgi:multidrug efflux pump subunit AcrA (membrane-fusion protein)
MKTVMTLSFCIAISLLASMALAQTGTEEGITAITVPSADVILSFVQPGLISKVLIKEGDKVEAEQMLIQQDLEAAEASLAQKKVDLKRLEWAGERGSATELEVEHARLDVKMAQIVVDRMCLKSPIAGIVDKVEVEVGEAINGLADVVRVVKTDLLWVDVPVPLSEGRTLKVGQIAEVKFPDSDKNISQAKIIYVSTVADAASSTLRVRIEVPNKLNRPAGEHVRIIFLAPEKQPVYEDIIKAEKPKDAKSN